VTTPLEAAFREHWGRVLACLVRFTGDVALAEDVTADAFAEAARRWGSDVPDNPAAWLVTTARNRAVDVLRRERVGAEKLRLLDLPDPTSAELADGATIPDERLELIFLCCHPALATEAQVALTLRALGGLSTGEIARAFLVGEETMKRRLTRARTKITVSGIPFSRPAPDRLAERLGVVLSVLYLIFNQGWDDRRADLAADAIRLARTVAGLLPGEGEATALLALMLLHDSRRAARVAGGVLVPLAEQDRSRWDGVAIAEGQAVLDRALAAGARGPYTVQAAIAALYTEEAVDWPGVVALHDRLVALSDGSPVVALNRAVAVAETEGPAAALALVDMLAPALGDYRYLPSTRADLLRRLGDVEAAREAYGRAIALAVTEPERRFLEGRLDRLGC
jgi:RNA polymerase sigma-70 factor, ECF subfamily